MGEYLATVDEGNASIFTSIEYNYLSLNGFHNGCSLSQVLDFSHLGWTSLPASLLPSSLKEIKLDGLPLTCDCSLLWLWEVKMVIILLLITILTFITIITYFSIPPSSSLLIIWWSNMAKTKTKTAKTKTKPPSSPSIDRWSNTAS